MSKIYRFSSIMGLLALLISIFLFIKFDATLSDIKKTTGPQIVSKTTPADSSKKNTVDDDRASNTDKAYSGLSSDIAVLTKRNRILKNNIIALKSRVTALETKLSNMAIGNANGNLSRQQKKRLEDTDFAQQRRQAAHKRDAGKYSRDILKKIEEQYRKGMKNIKDPKGQKALLDLYNKYPDSNRGGCAAMNLATELAGEGKDAEAAELLDRLINNESKSVFGNGVEVLPKSLFARAKMAKKQQDMESFDNIVQTMQESFPNEIDNNGKTFTSMLKKMGSNNTQP